MKMYIIRNFAFLYLGKVEAKTAEDALAKAQKQFRFDSGLMVEPQVFELKPQGRIYLWDHVRGAQA